MVEADARVGWAGPPGTGSVPPGLAVSAPATPPEALDAFQALDIRLGTVVAAGPNEGARKPAWRLEVDFGPELGRRLSSAQLTELYAAADLVGRQVLAVVNLPPRRVASVTSAVLVLGVPDAAGRIVLLAPERPAPDGARVS